MYVGKAKNLRKRVKSYFQKKDHDVKTTVLVSKIADVDFIVTNTEVEALILENNLVKKHQPKYNIDLKDAKSFAYLKITNEEFPRLVLLRAHKKSPKRNKVRKEKIFGPFISARDRDEIRWLLNRVFKIRTCKRLPKKVCLRFHIGLCSAPCEKKIGRTEYLQNVKSAEMILRGKTVELRQKLEKEMKEKSAKKDFEKALELRNQILAVKRLEEKQEIEVGKKYDQDVINFLIHKNKVHLFLFNVRNGTLENKKEFEFDFSKDFLEEFLMRYYSENEIPREIVLPERVSESMEEFLNQIKSQNSKTGLQARSSTKRLGSGYKPEPALSFVSDRTSHRRIASDRFSAKIRVIAPKVGQKKKLLDLVLRNIEIAVFGDDEKLQDLKAKLRMQETPKVIECFDISHLSGTSTVASMVQFKNGKPNKKNYRRFKIRTVKNIDDFEAIAEVVRRRYSRLQKENNQFPDLIVIDGGKGQLSAALTELQKLNLQIPIISLAKQLEEIFVPGRSRSIRLNKKTKALLLLREIRDEAHRFAIAYNRLLRKKKIKKG